MVPGDVIIAYQRTTVLSSTCGVGLWTVASLPFPQHELTGLGVLDLRLCHRLWDRRKGTLGLE